MVNPSRSLVTRVYLYAICVLVLSAASALLIGRALMDEGHLESQRQFGEDQAEFIGHEAEAAFKNGQPSPERLDALSRGLHVAIKYVPWTADARYPAELASDKVVARAGRPGPLGARAYWVRLDLAGKPVGALDLRFDRPRLRPKGPIKPRHQPAIAAAVWMGLLALMLVPPLWWWVLRPLRRMVAVAERLGQGDLATPVAVDRTDEFGELERAFESMRRRISDTIATRERLLRDISHELRAPLSRMAIALPLIREEHPENPFVPQLERDTAAMDALIGELLTLERGRRPETLEREPIDLAAIAAELLAERQLLIDRREAPVERALANAPAMGDRRLVARAMGNLIDNAFKYAPESPVRVETALEGERAVFRVIDQGPGIAAADLGQIFEPFYRPDASRSRETGGTGLGLAIVKAIAEAHHGEATLRSAEGRGTTAEWWVPGGIGSNVFSHG